MGKTFDWQWQRRGFGWFLDLYWFIKVCLARLFRSEIFRLFRVEVVAIHNCPKLLEPDMAIELILQCGWGEFVNSAFGFGTSHATYTTTWYEDEKPMHLVDDDVPLIDIKVYIPVQCKQCNITLNVGPTNAKPKSKEMELPDLPGMKIDRFIIPIGTLVQP